MAEIFLRFHFPESLITIQGIPNPTALNGAIPGPNEKAIPNTKNSNLPVALLMQQSTVTNFFGEFLAS